MNDGKTPFNLARAVHGRLRRINHINRYSSMPVVKYENVATHSWQAAMVGLLVSYDLNAAKPHTVDAGEVVKRCIVHDISEAMSGDIIRSYKHGTTDMERACAQADVSNTYRLTREFGDDVGDHIFVKWESAKDEGLAGDIVKLADAVCVITYCAEEWHMGNRLLDGVLEGLFDEILWPMREHEYLGKYIHQLFPNGKHTDAYDRDAYWVKTWKNPSHG